MKFYYRVCSAVFFILLFILSDEVYAQKNLTAEEANKLSENALRTQIILRLPKAELAWKTKELVDGAYRMKFDYKVFGNLPPGGRSLFISMHGGGNTSAGVNDQQWQNQLLLYKPQEGVYIVPRAPTDTWNMWHQAHIDTLFAELIKDAMVMEGVNLNKVYLMGYSAGGDGVYQLAPRMADFWAAAAAMAGHPGDAPVTSLRNLPFAIYAGGSDTAYHRNSLALEWGKRLDSLSSKDVGAYLHDTHVFPGMPHWMYQKDTIAVPWMSKFKRNPLPQKLVWVQDDVLSERFYWLGVPKGRAKNKATVEAAIDGNTIRVTKNDNEILYIYLTDRLMDLNKKVIVIYKEKQIFKGILPRDASVIKETALRMDKDLIFNCRIIIKNGKIE